MRYLVLAMLLTACGYEQGDFDRGLECTDGCDNSAAQDGKDGKDGRDGEQGPPGRDGVDGKNGSNCSVKALANGATIFCEDGTNAVLYNGTDGKDGIDGANQPLTRYTVTGVIDPCGKQASYDEILLRLEDGTFLAQYYDARRQLSFLTFIGPGNYITTDGTNCRFSITQDGRVTW